MSQQTKGVKNGVTGPSSVYTEGMTCVWVTQHALVTQL